MSDEILPFYGRELNALRRLGAEFSEANPKIAGRLRMGPDGVEDPHVSRLIEAVAYLNARIRRKLDDEFPELTESLLGILHPHFLAPVPSMAIVQFVGQPDLTAKHTIPAGTYVETDPIHGEPCRFRTAYGADFWPVAIESAKVSGRPLVAPEARLAQGAVASLRVVLRTLSPDTTFAQLRPQSLRFYLKGPIEIAARLYETLLNDCVGVSFARDPRDEKAVYLRESSIRPVGFARDEGLLPCPAASFPGYRLLTEYFTFPQKFLFVDVTDIPPQAVAAAGNELQLYFYLRRTSPDLEQNVGADSLALGCTPVVNLFPQRAEPIRLKHETPDHRVEPDARRPQALEIHSIDRVVATSPDDRTAEYLPLFSVRHATRDADRRRFWAAQRTAAGSVRGQPVAGTDVRISLVDLDLDPSSPEGWDLSVETTCLNRDLPARLPFGGEQPRLQLTQAAAPLSAIRCLTQPTPTLRPARGDGALWKIVSHLALGHLSITGGEEGANALREILRLHDVRDSAETRATIDGLVAVSARPATARAPRAGAGGICRGVEVRIEFAPERYTGGGLFLFATVLDRFLGLYCGINSFVRTVAAVRGREEPLRSCEPRAGDREVV